MLPVPSPAAIELGAATMVPLHLIIKERLYALTNACRQLMAIRLSVCRLLTRWLQVPAEIRFARCRCFAAQGNRGRRGDSLDNNRLRGEIAAVWLPTVSPEKDHTQIRA